MQNNILQKLPSGPPCFSLQGPGGLRRFRNSQEALLPPTLWNKSPPPRPPHRWVYGLGSEPCLGLAAHLLLAPCKLPSIQSTLKSENLEPFMDAPLALVWNLTRDSDLDARALDRPLLNLISSPSCTCSNHTGLLSVPQNKSNFFLPQGLCICCSSFS